MNQVAERTPVMFTVEQAAAHLKLPAPLDRKTLAALGRDCSLAAKVWNRPTGTRDVVGQPWPTVKTYTADVIREAFRRHPATRDYVPQEQTP